ncbi:uncharacterized protein LOC111043276 isoform X3 [Nilaparvata lugens]|uniref:uncharacterized protein LOC111043276 isoform X3 n=1 Tax=Nilaparvata lugens TaxID=108931 RepID=UPI00193CF220|nr:uncharacterized protein LOC111043276 isoform X3 [Nilaparvata lugens]
MPPVSRLYSTTSTSSPVSYSDGSGVFGADRSYLDPWDLENYAYLRRRYSEIEEPIVSLSAKSDFYYVSPDAYFHADNPGSRMNRRQSVMVPEQNHGYELAGIEEEHFSNQCLVDYERVPGNSVRAPQPPKTKKCSRQHNLHNHQPVAKLPKQQIPPRRHSSITFDQYQQKIYYPTVTEDIYSPGSVDFRASDDIYWCPSVKRSGKGSQQLLYVYQTQKPARRPTPAPGPNTNYIKRMSRFSCSDYQRLMPPPSLSSRYSTSERVTSTRGSTSTGAGSVTTSTTASTTDDPGEVGPGGRGGAEEADDLEMMGFGEAAATHESVAAERWTGAGLRIEHLWTSQDRLLVQLV